MKNRHMVTEQKRHRILGVGLASDMRGLGTFNFCLERLAFGFCSCSAPSLTFNKYKGKKSIFWGYSTQRLGI